MGLFTQTHQQYYEGSDYGNYQHIELKDIVNNFMVAYVGDDKTIKHIKRTDVAFHARRAIQELHYDTLLSSKSQEIEIPPSLLFTLPHDYVNYVKITWLDQDGIEHRILPNKLSSTPQAYLQDSDYNFLFDNNGNLLQPAQSETERKWQIFTSSNRVYDNSQVALDELPDYMTVTGGRYGLNPELANSNGVFSIDNNRGVISFSADLAGRIITLKYVSDGLAEDDEMLVHKFAEEAVYKHIAYGVVSTKANMPEYIIARYKKERFAATRKAKIRLSNYKSHEFIQLMRGKSKQIKH